MVSLDDAMAAAGCEIVDAKVEHCALLAEKIRDLDRRELEIMGIGVKRAVYRSFRISFYRKTAFVGGELAGMAGLAGDFFADTAVPWLLTTDVVARHPVLFLRVIQAESRRAKALYPKIENKVWAGYSGAVKLIQYCGLQLGEPEPAAQPGEFVRSFRWERGMD